jgi:hypothetical protein
MVFVNSMSDLSAADEKNREGNSLQLRADLAAEIRDWLSDKAAAFQDAASNAPTVPFGRRSSTCESALQVILEPGIGNLVRVGQHYPPHARFRCSRRFAADYESRLAGRWHPKAGRTRANG